MRVVTKHRPVDPAGFQEAAAHALAVLAEQSGFRSGELARSPDDAALWLLTTRWADAGSMRRGMGSFAAKVALGPVLPTTVDEPSVFEVLHEAAPGSVRTTDSDLAESD